MALKVSSERWRCLRCNYVLKGLAGDPVRCPECGQLNRYRDLKDVFDVSAESSDLRVSQTGYVFSTGGLLLIVAGIVVVNLEPLGLTFVGLGSLLWIGGMIFYRHSCVDRSAIWPAFFLFQAFFLLIVGVLFGLGTAWVLVARLLDRHYGVGLVVGGALATLGVVIVSGAMLPLFRRLLRSFARAWNLILVKQGYD